MEDGISLGENTTANKMGARNNNNVARIAALQERKKQIEETLAKRTQELRQLCIQEAELTGLTPPEMPLEPGETLPSVRRRVGTAYQLPENLIKNVNNKDETIAELELQIHWHANMAEAALGLANEQNLSRTMKRQHRQEYQKHKNQCIILQEKLAALKEKTAFEQHKQKKKPRVPELLDDNLSVNKSMNDLFPKSDIRHSLRSIKHTPPSIGERDVELRYPLETNKHHYRNSEMPFLAYQMRPEDTLASGIYRLSLNGYNRYMERRENSNNIYPGSTYNIQFANLSQYNLAHHSQMPQHTLHYQQMNPHITQYSSHMHQHSPHLSQKSLLSSQHCKISQQSPQSSQHSSHISSHNLSQQNIRVSQHSPQQNINYRASEQTFNYPHYSNDYTKQNVGSTPNTHFSGVQLRQQSSPTSLSLKAPYYSHTIHCQPSYRQYQNENVYRHPHQVQSPHQYEQMSVITSGLGGVWKQNENGELVWCNSNTLEAHWQRDKRFGSLDRRKNKRVSKRISPNMDNKSATLTTVSNYPDPIRSNSVKSSHIPSRRSQDNGQLVRTQSLGSVGAQTVDSVYPSDDTSSCGSENRGFPISQILRKNKEKEWLETSLDGPVSPTHLSQPTIHSIWVSEEKHHLTSSPQPVPPPLPPPITPKSPLEIPAESNPFPRVSEANIELFNNNIIPKNCTIVQAGHCKPYHEETKPFEMSDFYKYSTKFKRSPAKSEHEVNKEKLNTSNVNVSQHLEKSFEEESKVPCPPKQFYNDRIVGA